MSKHVSCGLVLLLSSTFVLFGQETVSRVLVTRSSTEIPFDFGPGTFGLWRGGALLAVRNRFSATPTISVFDSEGRQISEFVFSIPAAGRINLYNNSVARGMDGSLAFVGTAYSNDSRGGAFVAFVSSDGVTQTVVRVSPFFPHAMTLATDGSVWVAGDDTKKRPVASDLEQHIIRRYAANGRLLGSFIRWSEVQPEASGKFAPGVHSVFVSSTDRVGWYSPHARTYVEFSLEGKILLHIKTPEHSRGAMISGALCHDGRLYIGEATVSYGADRPASWGIFTLDRTRKDWRFFGQKEIWGLVHGCHENRLGVTTNNRTITWLELVEK